MVTHTNAEPGPGDVLGWERDVIDVTHGGDPWPGGQPADLYRKRIPGPVYLKVFNGVNEDRVPWDKDWVPNRMVKVDGQWMPLDNDDPGPIRTTP